MSLKSFIISVSIASPLLIALPAFAVEKPVDFVTKASQGGMLEVKLSKLALTKSKNPEIISFAKQMITDHTKANAKLKSTAAISHIVLPKKLDKDHQDTYNHLSKEKDDFDKDYISNMADDHKDDVALFDDFAKNGEESHLKTFAGDTLPTLIKHKDMVDALKAKM